jgi:hypothetical protein
MQVPETFEQSWRDQSAINTIQLLCEPATKLFGTYGPVRGAVIL